jgi:enoyl-CoA hydratase
LPVVTGSTLITTTLGEGVLHAVMVSPPDNAPEPPLVRALTALVERFRDGDAKVLVLSSGLPGCFVTAEAPAPPAASPEAIADFHDAVRRPLERLALCHRPSIAAIDGRATGLGLELALACTLRFCSPGSRLGLPAARLGSVPGAGGTQRLPRLIGSARALDLILTGRVIAGDEALRIGLVERLFYRHVVEESLGIARAIASSSGPAMALIMSCVEAALDLPHDQGISVERAALLSMLEDEVPVAVRRTGAAS